MILINDCILVFFTMSFFYPTSHGRRDSMTPHEKKDVKMYKILLIIIIKN